MVNSLHAKHTKEPTLFKTCVNWLINWANKPNNPNSWWQTAAFNEKKSDQNVEKNQSYETFYIDLIN